MLYHRVIAGLIAASAVTAACSGGGDDTVERSPAPTSDSSGGSDGSGENAGETGAPSDSTVAGDDSSSEGDRSEDAAADGATAEDVPTPPVTTSPAQPVSVVTENPETGLPELIEEIPAGPATYEDVVDRGIEAGLWDDLEGITRVLGYAVGGVSADQVPGVDDVISGEMRELLLRANAYALSGDYTDDELAELRHWFEVAVLSPEQRDAIVGTATSASFAGSGFRSAAAGCVPVDPEAFSGRAVVEGCYQVHEADAAGVKLRVFFPTWYLEDPSLADGPLVGLEALAHSVETYAGFGAPVGDIDMVFSSVTTPESRPVLAVATVDAQWGTASINGPCPVTTFPHGVDGGAEFQQTVAHEVWHCVQREYGYAPGVPVHTKWFVEGGAEYFSNVAYPAVDAENGFAFRFDNQSHSTPLFDLGYAAWVWWQYVGNEEGPASVADMHARMEQQGDGGRAIMAGYGKQFQRFVVDYLAGVISDEGDGFVPRGIRYIKPNLQVVNNDDGRELKMPVQPFVAARWWIEYDKQLRVLQTDQTATVGEIAMAKYEERLDPLSWKAVAPEIRSKCTAKVYYGVVATTHEGSHEARVRIDKTEQAVCDPCLIGTWDLNLDTFKDMILSAAGGSFPPGADIAFGGNYYLELDELGDLKIQRDGLQIITSADGFSVTFTIDSFGTGRYTADGENLAAVDLVDQYVTVESSIGFGGPEFSDSNVFGDEGRGTYVCDEHTLSVVANNFPEIIWHRVDQILQPSITVP